MSLDQLDEDLLSEARIYYNKRNFKMLEPLLQQMISGSPKSAEVFHMQANLYLSRGQFSKSIKSFKQALEIDPGYSESSIGLSVLLNDLGKYQEAREIYEKAEKFMEKQKTQADPGTNEKLASKHEELADLYIQTRKYTEAIEQLQKALELSQRKAEISMRVIDLWIKTSQESKAIKELRQLIATHPHFVQARLKLGLIYYGMNKLNEAIEQWETVLLRDSENSEAIRYIKMAKSNRSQAQAIQL